MLSTWTLVSATRTFSATIGAMPCSANSQGVLRLRLTLDSASRRGVIVTNTPDVLSDCVADLAIGLCVAIARKICMADAFVRSGAWLSGHSFPLGVKVSGKRMGLLGMGRIGQEIAARAAAFKMHVSYHSRRKASVPFMYYDNLLDLAKNSDFLGKSNQIQIYNLHVPHSPLQVLIITSLPALLTSCAVVICPGGPSTFHIVNAPVLDALGPNGFLINVARGSVVDEAALLQRLQDRKLGGAALDVFEQEPKM